MQQEGPLIPGGYILLSRKIIESEIWQKPPLYLKVWIYLLTSAQHKEYKGLRRGQVRTSIPQIIEACSWKVGFRTERPSKDQIYQILSWLREVGKGAHEADTRATTKATMITTTRATHGILINVDNYSFYQDSKNYESNDEGNDEGNDEDDTKPDNTNKNDKNVKNDKKFKHIDSFKAYTSNPNLLSTLIDFYEMRKSIKKPLNSQRAATLLFNKLNELADNDEKKIAILEQSIFNTWQGVFELKNNSRFNRQDRPLTRQEQNKRILEKHMNEEVEYEQKTSESATYDLFDSLPSTDDY